MSTTTYTGTKSITCEERRSAEADLDIGESIAFHQFRKGRHPRQAELEGEGREFYWNIGILIREVLADACEVALCRVEAQVLAHPALQDADRERMVSYIRSHNRLPEPRDHWRRWSTKSINARVLEMRDRVDPTTCLECPNREGIQPDGLCRDCAEWNETQCDWEPRHDGVWRA